MSDRVTWWQQADLVYADDILGEDDRGFLWVPSRTEADWWDRPFRWWKPTHWPYYVRSRRRRQVAFLETSDRPGGVA